jgi:hypothetical protein
MGPLARAAAITLLAGTLGCTVSLGPVPDAAPCRPSTAFFADPLWLSYFDRNSCLLSGCHAFADGKGYLRLHPPGAIPVVPYAEWPVEWQENYEASIQLYDCAAPLQSRLLTVPEGLADPHPVGDQIQDHAAAEALMQQWATAL